MLLINYCLHFEHHIVKAQKMKGTTQKKNRNFTNFGDVSGNIAQLCNSLVFTDGYKNAVILCRKKSPVFSSSNRYLRIFLLSIDVFLSNRYIYTTMNCYKGNLKKCDKNTLEFIIYKI